MRIITNKMDEMSEKVVRLSERSEDFSRRMSAVEVKIETMPRELKQHSKGDLEQAAELIAGIAQTRHDENLRRFATLEAGQVQLNAGQDRLEQGHSAIVTSINGLKWAAGVCLGVPGIIWTGIEIFKYVAGK
jgi:hypothetical protein